MPGRQRQTHRLNWNEKAGFLQKDVETGVAEAEMRVVDSDCGEAGAAEALTAGHMSRKLVTTTGRRRETCARMG